jgi:hypothetical protein
MGTKLNLSTTFYPQTDGQSERTIQTLEDLLRSCVLEFGGNWEDLLLFVEFTYNNSHQTTIGMAPYKALYGRKCHTVIFWDEVGERKLLGPEMVQLTTNKVRVIKKRMNEAQDRQKKASFDWNKREISPRYIGPSEIKERIRPVAYQLELLVYLNKIHNVFHVSLL